MVFIAVIVARVGSLHTPYTLRETGNETIATGRSLATTGDFANPYLVLDTGPTAHVAPAFPALVGLVIRIFGDGYQGNFVLGALNMLVVALQLSLLPLLTTRMRLGELTGAIGALCLLIGAYEKVHSEPNYLGLFFILVAFLMMDLQEFPVSSGKLVFFACLWGVILVVSPTALFVLFASLIWLLQTKKIRYSKLLIPVLIPFLATAPWIYRNYQVFHRFIFIRGNLGTELALSFNPCAHYSFDSLLKNPGDCPAYTHPNLDPQEAQLVLALGEAEYNRKKLKLGIEEIKSAPARALVLVSERFFAFWFPPESGEGIAGRYTGVVLINAFTILSIPGLWMMWRRHRAAAKVLLAWLVFFPPIYYIIVFSGRFRYCIAWATFIPGAYFLIYLMSGATTPEQIDPEPPTPF
jgi:hypothetical protein